MKDAIGAFENLHKTGIVPNYQTYVPEMPLKQREKTENDLSKFMPSNLSFWNVEMLPSFVDYSGNQKSQLNMDESLPKITNHALDDSKADICENYSIYHGVYLNYRVPKVWIDYQHKFDRLQKGTKASMNSTSPLIKAQSNFSKNRATKLSMAIIKAQMKFKKLLIRVRANLKNATYFNISMRTHIEYIKLGDGTVMRVIVISDTQANGYNKKTTPNASRIERKPHEKKNPLALISGISSNLEEPRSPSAFHPSLPNPNRKLPNPMHVSGSISSLAVSSFGSRNSLLSYSNTQRNFY